MTSRIPTLALALAILIAGATSCKEPTTIPDLSCAGCNVILIDIELLRADFVGLLNGERPSRTPNIDHFFENSIIFEQVSSPAGESYRGDMAVQTARHAHRFGIESGDIDDLRYPYWYRDLDRKAIQRDLTRFPNAAEILSDVNYNAVGINHGSRAGSQVFMNRGFQEFYEWLMQPVLVRQPIGRLLEELASTKLPMFLYCRTDALHALPVIYPLDRPRRVSEKIRYEHDKRNHLMLVFPAQKWKKESPIDVYHQIYAQQLEYVDEELAEVFHLLEERDLIGNSIIVLYANHGDSLGENDIRYGKHGVSYQTNIHVPLFIRHPKVNLPVRIDSPVSLMDLMPTIYDFLGLGSGVNGDGVSLVPLIRDGKQVREFLFGRNDHDEYVRHGKWKLIRGPLEYTSLFDLSRDPGETDNVVRSHPDIKLRLKLKLEQLKVELVKKNTTNE